MREQHGFAKEQLDSQTVSSGSQSSGEKPNTTPPSALQRFGNYDLVQRIGIGGMGEVYLARQRTAFGREVAVKIIRSDLMNDITIRKRFLREAEVNAYLKHDHILPLVEFGEERGRLFLVTPYIKGGTLSKRLRGGSLPLAETHELFTALVHAVAYLHKRGVIHRDLKPSNILLDHQEDSEHIYVRLIDFGIASLQGRTASAPLTSAGHEMGTEAYMAPERLDGIAAPSNDIYSLGIILYQMLTGKLPEQNEDMILPEPLIEVVQQSTVSDPSERYASAEELLRAFEHAYKSLSLSHFRLTGSNPDLPPIGRNSSASSSPPTPVLPQAPLSVPPVSNEPTWRPPLTPALNAQARGRPNTSNYSPALNRPNPPNAQSPTPYAGEDATHRGGASPHPTSSSPHPAWQNENVMEPRSRPSQLSNPTRLRAEVVLPPLPDRTGPFKGEDYEAPTSYVTPEPPQPKPLPKGIALSDAPPSRVEQSPKVAPRPPQKKRAAPIATIISVIIIIVVFVIGSIAYSIYQSLNTATITITPRLETLSSTFDLTVKLNQTTVDSKGGVIPAQILNSTKSAPKTGNTTGQADCTLFVIDCKQSVSFNDVENLRAQLRPAVESQIEQDIRQQEQAQGITPIGKIIFMNEITNAIPQVGTISKTVTVTLFLQGSQEYIKSSDAREFAKQKFQGQLKQNYNLVDGSIQVGQPAVQNVDKQGTAQIKMAAAAVSRYTISENDKTDIKNHIAGKSQKEARAFIAQKPNLDSSRISMRISAGENLNLPGSGDQITVNAVDPPTIPSVQLPTVSGP